MEIKIEQNLCRICLTNVGKISFFSDQGDGIQAAEVISSLFKIDVISNANLPDTVCPTCMENIKSAVKTKEQILNSEILLSAYLEINKSMAEESETLQTDDGKPKLVHLEVEHLNIECLDNGFQDSDSVSPNPTINKEKPPDLSFPGMYDCLKCEFKAATYKTLLSHMRSHEDLMLYECEICGKSCHLQSAYRRHRETHRDSRPFKCTKCYKTFRERCQVAQHLLSHQREPVIPCPICKKKFCHMKALKQHIRIHNKRTEECSICHKMFQHATLLKKHISLCHSRRKKQQSVESKEHPLNHLTTCHICGKQMARNNLQKHFDAKHFVASNDIKERRKPVHCTFCDKRFPYTAALNIHLQCHFNSRKVPMDAKTKEQLLKHKCNECDKAFTSNVHLKKHKISHSGVKDHVCVYCGKRFALKMYLVQHVRLNHELGNPQNWSCDICGKVSVNKTAMETHMRSHSHTRETPFHCNFCNSKFVYAKSLRLHIRNKHHT